MEKLNEEINVLLVIHCEFSGKFQFYASEIKVKSEITHMGDFGYHRFKKKSTL
jgi:hypothetical protein